MMSRSEYWVAFAAIIALSVAVAGVKAMSDADRKRIFGV
jgi:uncharacterized membrane protein YhaH (DUF805 family)